MSELTVHMLKYIVRVHVCCPRIQNAENHIFRALKFKIFWGGMHFDLPLPPPCRKGGPTAPCWYSRLLYPNRWLLQFLLKPLVPPLENSSNHDDSKGNKKIKKQQVNKQNKNYEYFSLFGRFSFSIIAPLTSSNLIRMAL